MSVAKSFVSALIGIAQAEGAIRSLEDPINQYATGLNGSAYEGVRIKDVLQMSSGARWNEDYSDRDSEIFRLSEATGPEGSFDKFMALMPRETEPGTRCMYNSADTQALGMLIAGATGVSLTEYMQDKLYTPLGMESPGHWVIDSTGREMAYAGLLMTARDFAKLGELYRNNGLWQGRQIVPGDYVTASIQADAPHVQPGGPIVGDHSFGPGYGYQWWLPAGGLGDYSAIGVCNQRARQQRRGKHRRSASDQPAVLSGKTLKTRTLGQFHSNLEPQEIKVRSLRSNAPSDLADTSALAAKSHPPTSGS